MAKATQTKEAGDQSQAQAEAPADGSNKLMLSQADLDQIKKDEHTRGFNEGMKSASEPNPRERQLVITQLQHFVKDFNAKVKHPKNLADLYPHQELVHQIINRFEVRLKA